MLHVSCMPWHTMPYPVGGGTVEEHAMRTKNDTRSIFEVSPSPSGIFTWREALNFQKCRNGQREKK